jgi:hypothetical protein
MPLHKVCFISKEKNREAKHIHTRNIERTCIYRTLEKNQRKKENDDIMEMSHESIDRNNTTVTTLHYKFRIKLCNGIFQVSWEAIDEEIKKIKSTFYN